MRRTCAALYRPFSSKQKQISVDKVKKSRFLEFAITGDLYRIDVGFLLMRPPIIEDLTETEMKRRILLHRFKKANDLYPKVEESLFDFPMKDPLEDIKTKDPTYRITHELRRADGSYQRYHRFSRDINHIDLEERDLQSIQTYPKHSVYMLVKDSKGKWGIPHKILDQEVTFGLDVDRLKYKILGMEISTVNMDNYPSFCFQEKISEEELAENRLLSKAKGKKIYGFKVILNTGHINDHVLKHYEDFHWVPKVKFRDYLDKENYERVIHCLTN